MWQVRRMFGLPVASAIAVVVLGASMSAAGQVLGPGSQPGGGSPSPIDPPGGGCPCGCPQPPETPADMYFCGDRCEAIALGVNAAALADWIGEHCLPFGGDSEICLECEAERLPYHRALCECQNSEEFDCDRDDDLAVTCADLRNFLDGITEPCTTRAEIKELICCFLSHVQRSMAEGGCETAWSGTNECAAVRECLEEIHDRPPGQTDLLSSPLTEAEIDFLLVCYGCEECCVSTGENEASYVDCDAGDGFDCDRNGDAVVDCEDFESFLEDARACLDEEQEDFTDEQKLDLACRFVEECAGEDPCVLARIIVDCLEKELCRALTAAEMEFLAACTDCAELDECCVEINDAEAWGGAESVVADYAQCGATIRCDQDCDGDSDCDDFWAFVAESEETCAVTYERTQILLLACAFLTEGQCVGGDLCAGIVQCLNDRFLLVEPTPWGLLSVDELEQLAQCADCGEICGPHDSDASAGAGGETCNMPTSPNPVTPHGVQLPFGDTWLRSNDLWIAATGAPVSLEREYSSNPAYVSGCATGEGWSLSAFRHVTVAGNTLTLHLGAGRQVAVDVSGGAVVADAVITAGYWRVPGPTTEVVYKTLAAYPGGTYAVWRVGEFGGAMTDYFRVPESGETTTAMPAEMIGLIAGVADVYPANRQAYEYGLWLGPGSSLVPRLSRIVVNPSSTQPPAAVVRFSYHTGLDGNPGRLRHIAVTRPDEQGDPVAVQTVAYHYVGDSDLMPPGLTMSDDVGTDGDLVLVVRSERVDPLPGATAAVWRDRVTHYRYHRSAASGAMIGADHQLKMVIEPEQMEFAAAKASATATTVSAFAPKLLAFDDDDEVWWDGAEIATLAGRVYPTYESSGERRVTTASVRSGCGCGGGSPEQVEFTYSYVASTASRATVKAVEAAVGMPYQRWHWFETYAPGGSGTQYLRANVMEERTSGGAATGRAWVSWFDHDTATGLLVMDRTPAMFPDGMATTPGSHSYEPGDGANAPAFNPAPAAGLARRYTYVPATDSNKRGVRRLQSVELGQGASPSPWVLVEDRTYGGSRGHLLSQIRRYATTSTSPGADDIEVTKFTHGFFGSTSDDIAWERTEVEAELVAENGPSSGSTWYSTHELYDAAGQNIWSVAADGALTKRTFAAPSGQYATRTGMPLSITRNAQNSGLASPYHGLTTSGFGRYSTTGDALTTSFRRDLDGRVQETISPGGVSTYTLRTMSAHPWRPTVPHYMEANLPYQWTDTTLFTAGAASKTWLTASNAVLGASEYLVDDTAYTFSSATSGWQVRIADYALADEVGRRVTGYLYNGLVEWDGFWTALVSSPNTFPFDGAHATWFHYDALGRLEHRVAANGTVTRFHHDVLDRIVAQGVDVLGSGGALPGSTTTVVEYGYDGGAGGAGGTPVVGNGNLTSTRQLLAAGDRETNYSYDFRDRRYLIENAEPPHELVVHDNLDRVTERGLFSTVPTVMDETDRGLHTTSSYSQRGLLYRQQIDLAPDSTSPSYLETHHWYDETGRVVATWRPNSPATKTAYDGLGRVTETYATDRRSDTSYSHVHASHAAVVSDDVVFEQRSQAYDSASGRPTLATVRRRAHNAGDSRVGALSAFAGGDASYVVTTYAQTFYDEADRPTHEVDFGTNHSDDILRTGGSAPTSATPPASWNSTNALMTVTSYDGKGRVETVTDPENRATRFVYDMADRRIAVIENHDDSTGWSIDWNSTAEVWVVGGLAGSTPDVNRTTTYVYDGVGATTRLIAYNAPELSGAPPANVTEYVHEARISGTPASAINTNDVVSHVSYPHDSGLGTSGNPPKAYYAAYAYNEQGEVAYMEEGAGTGPGSGSIDLSSSHTYSRDGMGRVRVDKADDFHADIDDRVDAITYRYDDFGRLDLVRSHDGYVGTSSVGTIVNAVAMTEFTPLWQVRHLDQNPVGDVASPPSSPTERVTYAYDDEPASAGNHSRPESLTYPDSTVVNVAYGASSSASDWKISRATKLSIGSAALVEYSRVGLDTFVIVDYDEPNVQLDRFRAEGGGRTAGHYPGLDRFGRVRRQLWVDGAFAPGSGSNPNKPPIVETLYGYDRVGNRLLAADDRPGATQELSHAYVYDKLHRLIEARRGLWNGSTVTQKKSSQRWWDGTDVTLDALGNWRRSWTDRNGDGTYAGDTELDERNHDELNRITTRELYPTGGSQRVELGVTTGSPKYLEYDTAANLKAQNMWTGTGATTKTHSYKHDAWNRLVEVRVDSTIRASYGYNGLHWRTLKLADATGSLHVPDGTIDQIRLMYHGIDWRLLEERIDDGASSSMILDDLYDPSWNVADVDRRQQCFWGERYIDDIVMHRMDRNGDGDYVDTVEGPWYHLTDAQFSSVCLVGDTAGVIERVTYSAYGEAGHHREGDIDGNGSTDSADLGLLNAAYGTSIGGSGYNPDADLDRNGTVNGGDTGLLLAAYGGALPPGQLSDISGTGPDNVVGWDGYVFNAESGLYTVRFRTYEPGLGRWLERDPAYYVDGVNLYQYTASNPLDFIDPFGLRRCGPHVWALTGDWCADDDVFEAAFVAYGTTANDRVNGLGDAVGIEGLAQYLFGTDYTFDELMRREGRCFAECYGAMLTNMLLEKLAEVAINFLPAGGLINSGVGLDVCDLIEFGLQPDNAAEFVDSIVDKYTAYLERRIKEKPWKKIPTKGNPGPRADAKEMWLKHINEVKAVKNWTSKLSKMADWLDAPYKLTSGAYQCYTGCQEDPCASPCDILGDK